MVAIRDMSMHTNAILIEDPHSANAFQTFRVNGATELRPGYVCTATGHTWPDIGRPDGAQDYTLGIVLDNADLDINAWFPDNTVVTVALRGGQASVWGYGHDDTGAYAQGASVTSTGASNNGFITVGDDSYEFVGYIYEDSPADTGYYRPVKLKLG